MFVSLQGVFEVVCGTVDRHAVCHVMFVPLCLLLFVVRLTRAVCHVMFVSLQGVFTSSCGSVDRHAGCHVMFVSLQGVFAGGCGTVDRHAVCHVMFVSLCLLLFVVRLTHAVSCL